MRTIIKSAANTKDTTAPKASNITEHNGKIEIGIPKNEIIKFVAFKTHPYQIDVTGILINLLFGSNLQQMY